MPETHGTGRHQTKVSAFLSTFIPKGENQMNKEAMKQQIQEALSKKLGDGFHITIQKVFKPNMELDGLLIMGEGEIIGPTIYLEPSYEALDNGTPVEQVVDRILQAYDSAKSETVDFDTERLSDFDSVKDRLYAQLVNRHLNKNMLQSVPHAMFLDDFAIIIRCAVETSEDCDASFMVHNSHLDIWHTDRETILSLAISNTLAKQDVDLMPLGQLIRERVPAFPDECSSDCKIWFMSNKKRNFGATAVLHDDVLKSFAEKHGSFYVIFSSVHEVLIKSSPDNSDIDILTKHNQDVNASALEEDEILGTKAYFYQKGRGFIL